MFKNFFQGILSGLGFLFMVGLGGLVYATWDYSNTVNPGDSLTAEKWNSLKGKVASNDASITSNSGAIASMIAAVVPSGAVMAFNVADCPTGWSEYTLAYGRFIRGIDKSGTNIDPDGQRVLGNLQEATSIYNEFGNNTSPDNHDVVLNGDGNHNVSTTGLQFSYSHNTKTFRYDYVRPKNVSLLYCIKD